MLIFALRVGQLLSAFAGGSFMIYVGAENGWIVGGASFLSAALFTILVEKATDALFGPGESRDAGDGAADVLLDTFGPDGVHDRSVRKLPGPDSR